jgi:hypothetical protein
MVADGPVLAACDAADMMLLMSGVRRLAALVTISD